MEDFGAHQIRGKAKLLSWFIKAGLGRGKLKHWFSDNLLDADDTTIIDIEYHGLKLRLHPARNTIEKKILLSSRQREAQELAWLTKSFRNGGTFIDIGANMGYYSLNAARLGATKVIAFEPNPNLFDRFQFHISLNDMNEAISALQIGLGGQDGELDLVINAQDYGSSSVVNPDIEGQAIQIKVTTLLAALEKQSIDRIDVMKIDIEGMEDQVLTPFFETAPFALHPTLIIIEDNRSMWQQDILSDLLNSSYEIADETRANLILRRKD